MVCRRFQAPKLYGHAGGSARTTLSFLFGRRLTVV